MTMKIYHYAGTLYKQGKLDVEHIEQYISDTNPEMIGTTECNNYINSIIKEVTESLTEKPMTYTAYIKTYKDNFFGVIDTKTNWGKLQLAKEFTKAKPECEHDTSFITILTTQFADKISTKTNWGKNQVELMFTQSVANAALITLSRNEVK